MGRLWPECAHHRAARARDAAGHPLATEAPPPGILAATAAMSAARMAHTASTLPDGRVLVTGGFIIGDSADHGAEASETAR